MRGLGGLAKLLVPLAIATALLVAPNSPAGSLPLTQLRHEGHPAIPGHQVTTSSNWSGYVATGATFSDVVGTWTEPNVTCTGKAAQYATFWVGFDGYQSGDKSHVEQIGTDSDCTAAKGKKHPSTPYYFSWWDIYPQVLQVFPESSCPLAPGDSVTGEVSASNGEVTFTMSDSTQGWQCTASQTLSPPGESAEWIVEAPTVGRSDRVLPLANFSSVNFSGASANGTPISGLSSEAITMQSGGTTTAAPSALGSDGASFTVTWMNS